MQNLLFQYQKLMSDNASIVNNRSINNDTNSLPTVSHLSPLILSSIMSSMAAKGTCLSSVHKKPSEETPLDLCTKRTPSPLNLNSIDSTSRRSPPSSPSYDMSPCTPTSFIASVPSKPSMIWSPASSCEEEENAKKFFNIKNNNTFQSNELSSTVLGSPNNPMNPMSSICGGIAPGAKSNDRNAMPLVVSPSLNHLGQIREFSFKTSQNSQTTSASSSPLSNHVSTSNHMVDDNVPKKGRIFKV